MGNNANVRVLALALSIFEGKAGRLMSARVIGCRLRSHDGRSNAAAG